MCAPTVNHNADLATVIEQVMHTATTGRDEAAVVVATRDLEPTVYEYVRDAITQFGNARTGLLTALGMLPREEHT